MAKLKGWAGAVALALAACGSAQAAPAADACRMVKVGELPVKFEHNRPTVPVSVNGRSAWMLVDTGAAATVLFGGAARALGLGESTVEGMRFFGVGGGQQAYAAVVRDFEVAGVKARGLKLFVIGGGGSADEAGLLGRDILRHWDLEFDLAAKVLRLWTPQHCGGRSLAYWTQEPELAELDRDDAGDEYRVRIRLNGKPFEATLDSGADTSVVTLDMASSAGVGRADYETGVGHSYGIGEAAVATRIAVFKEIQIGDETVAHARLQVADLYAANTERQTGSILQQRVEGLHNPDMLLGADFLRSHRVLIAASQGRLYFTYSGGPVFQSVGAAVAPAQPAPASPASPKG